MPAQIILAQYLFTRLRQLGCTSIHGVPGDFNLTLLDHVGPSGLHWIGNCNELNAGYAADGYARVKGLGALVTTFGVGELSAVNAIAGAYAELAPVVHIVGIPSRQLQEAKVLLHHTFADGEYRRFARMAVPITVAQAELNDPRTAADEVDRVLRECLLQSRPVYLELPTDMVTAQVDGQRLEHAIEIPLAPADAEAEAKAAQTVLERIYGSKRPMILTDGESRSFGIKDEINELVRATGFPTFTTQFGKSVVEESLPNFHGIYSADMGKMAAHKAEWDSADLILCFGPHYSDTNTYGFRTIPPPGKTITFKRSTLEIFSLSSSQPKPTTHADLPVKSLLKTILASLSASRLPTYAPYPSTLSSPARLVASLPHPAPSSPFSQDHFWQHISRQFLRRGDIILTETGTAGHGARDFALPPQCMLFGPNTWLSIGYMLPATQGAAVAQAELLKSRTWAVTKGRTGEGEGEGKGRTILFEGDGSLQMTVQELSTLLHQGLEQPVFMFVVNNKGYTIERCIHGWKAGYNDVVDWNYTLAGEFFGAVTDDTNPETDTQPENEKGNGTGRGSLGLKGCRSWKVRTYGELDALLAEEGFADGRPGLRLVECVFAVEDAPAALLALTGNPPREVGAA